MARVETNFSFHGELEQRIIAIQRLEHNFKVLSLEDNKVYDAEFNNHYIIVPLNDGWANKTVASTSTSNSRLTNMLAFYSNCMCMNSDEYQNYLKYKIFGGTDKKVSDFITYYTKKIKIPNIRYYVGGLERKFRFTYIFDIDGNVTNIILNFLTVYVPDVDITDKLRDLGFFDNW